MRRDLHEQLGRLNWSSALSLVGVTAKRSSARSVCSDMVCATAGSVSRASHSAATGTHLREEIIADRQRDQQRQPHDRPGALQPVGKASTPPLAQLPQISLSAPSLSSVSKRAPSGRSKRRGSEASRAVTVTCRPSTSASTRRSRPRYAGCVWGPRWRARRHEARRVGIEIAALELMVIARTRSRRSRRSPGRWRSACSSASEVNSSRSLAASAYCPCGSARGGCARRDRTAPASAASEPCWSRRSRRRGTARRATRAGVPPSSTVLLIERLVTIVVTKSRHESVRPGRTAAKRITGNCPSGTIGMLKCFDTSCRRVVDHDRRRRAAQQHDQRCRRSARSRSDRSRRSARRRIASRSRARRSGDD